MLMRGGTSKSLFFRQADLRAAGRPLRATAPAQARDGHARRAADRRPGRLAAGDLEGPRSSSCSRPPPTRRRRLHLPCAQADVDRDLIGYDANCGNISSAVAPFAIDEGLVEATEPVTTVRIYNTNTGTLLVSKVQVKKRQGRRSARRLRDRRRSRYRRRDPDGLHPTRSAPRRPAGCCRPGEGDHRHDRARGRPPRSRSRWSTQPIPASSSRPRSRARPVQAANWPDAISANSH